MKRLNRLIPLLAIFLLFSLAACNEVKYADRTLKVCEGLYTTVWDSSHAVYADAALTEEDREQFKDRMLPLLQIAEGSLKAANVSLQTYIKVKDTDAKTALLSNFGDLVDDIMVLVNSYNEIMSAVGGKTLDIPDSLNTAFGLLS